MENNGQSEIVSFCLVFRAFWQINSTASWPTVPPPLPHPSGAPGPKREDGEGDKQHDQLGQIMFGESDWTKIIVYFSHLEKGKFQVVN